MTRFLVRRLILSVFVIAGVLVITFFLTRVLPSDPARLMVGGERATAEAVAEARQRLGLDQPVIVQFARYLSQVATGDLGVSYRTHRSVVTDVAIFLPATVQLIVPALALAIILGVPIGLLAGSRSQSPTDRNVRLLAIAGAAVPAFWAGMMLQLVLASGLGWFPVGGQMSLAVASLHPVTPITGIDVLDAAMTGNWTAFGDIAWHMALPIAALMIHPTSLVIRMTRASVEEVMNDQYVMAARAAGIPEREVLRRDVLKNAISPTLTVIGLAFASAFTGTLLVEVVFAWPGLGTYVTGAILASDFAAILAVALVVTLIYVAVNFAVDIVQALLDPRIRLDAR